MDCNKQSWMSGTSSFWKKELLFQGEGKKFWVHTCSWRKEQRANKGNIFRISWKNPIFSDVSHWTMILWIIFWRKRAPSVQKNDRTSLFLKRNIFSNFLLDVLVVIVFVLLVFWIKWSWSIFHRDGCRKSNEKPNCFERHIWSYGFVRDRHISAQATWPFSLRFPRLFYSNQIVVRIRATGS